MKKEFNNYKKKDNKNRNVNRNVNKNERDFKDNTQKGKYKNREVTNKKEVINEEEKNYDDQIEGRNSVLELLDSGKDINKIFVIKGEKHGSINKIIAIAKEKKIVIVEKDRRQMEEMAESQNCQGVIAIVPPFEYCEVEEILDYAKSKKEDPFIIILDGIEDPYNLGAIIRTAETAGVHGIIIPKRRAVSVNSTVNKVSAGAAEYIRIARVNNISDSIEQLKQEGLWICGTDIETEKYYYNQDLKGALGIVIGNEKAGISLKVKKNCDFLVKIPMRGKITSLNASVSAGIIMYEAIGQRIKNILKKD